MRANRSKHLDTSVEQTQRTFIKLALGGLLAIVLLIAICWGGRGIYVRWQERRLVRQALAALDNHDLRQASLAARTVLELKPTSVRAARIMADVGERVGDRGALDWRRKVAELEPHSVDDILALARCALLFNDSAMADRVLAKVEPPGNETAPYHAMAGFVAQAKQQNEKAEKEWEEAVRLAPNEKGHQLQLGIAKLRAHDPARHAAGETILRSLRDDPAQRAAATRALITDGVARHEDGRRLLELARDLQSYPGVTWTDRLMYADLLHQLHDPQFSSYLTELEKSAGQRAVDLAALLSWMARNNLNLLALDFLTSVPAELLQKMPVSAAVADIYVRLKEWGKLEGATKAANWGDFDFLRHAYFARALREQDKPAAGEHEWAAALKGASGRSESAMMLLRTVSEWRWEAEMIDLLWALSKQPDKQSEAFLTLYRHYAKNGDTQGLYKVLVRLFESDPTNLKVQNNLAQVSLLLNANPEEARRLAADAYRKMPSDPAYVTTYAYSLMTKGDTAGALKAMKSLSEEQLAEPAISAYYGICLAALKDERARAFLQQAQGATLLPEERALVTKAESSLN